MADFLETASGRRIAYVKTEGNGPGVVFLGGFMSDMEGSKAVALEAWAKRQGRPFLRFDYSGHGQSSGEFTDGCIGDWAEDARAVIETLTEGPQLLVGSSMGGWISALTIRAIPERIAGFIMRRQLMEEGQVFVPSGYDEPYPVTKRLIEDGREQLVLRKPLPMPFPVRLFQGTADDVVDRQVALNLLDHIDGEDLHLTFVTGADHSFSTPENLALIEATLDELLA
ncbi:MAG: alpha/beta hydrolase [Maritimibacter sp.]